MRSLLGCWLRCSSLVLVTLAACASGGMIDPAPVSTPEGPRLALSDGAPRVIVGEARGGLSRGPITLASASGVVTLRRDVDPAALSPEEGAWVGRRVRLSGPRGVVCEGVASSLAVEARVMPDPSLVDALLGDASEWHGDPVTLLSTWELAEQAGSVALVADVDAVEACDGALWGEPATSPPKVTRGIDDADADTRAVALEAFRALPAWRDAEARFRADEAPTEAALAARAWDELGGEPDVKLVEGGALVIVTKDVGGACGEFDASLTAVFRPVIGAGGAALELVHDPSRGRAFDVLGAVDLDGDGALELLVPGGFRRGASLDDEVTSEVPFLGCPC
ncbi:MAG: hypothetical protein IT374_13555 [Polyangiaceae bacterium]|nr:hypothetical protein [Polyangiaceae bacterium]